MIEAGLVQVRADHFGRGEENSREEKGGTLTTESWRVKVLVKDPDEWVQMDEEAGGWNQ